MAASLRRLESRSTLSAPITRSPCSDDKLDRRDAELMEGLEETSTDRDENDLGAAARPAAMEELVRCDDDQRTSVQRGVMAAQ